jgi:hypothetical protein
MIANQTGRILLFASCFLLLTGFTPNARAENNTPHPADLQSRDSTLVRWQKMHSSSGWEKAAKLPGQIIYFPFKYAMKGINATIGYIDETKIVARVDDLLTSDDGRRGVEPTYANRTGAGITFYQKGLFHPGIDRNVLELTLTGWDLGRQRYQIGLEDVKFGGGIFWSGVRLRYWKLPTESFFGIGPESDFSTESNFTQEQTMARIETGIKLHRIWTFGARLGYDYTNISAGGDPALPSTTDQYTPESLPGLEENVEIVYGGMTLQLDSKDHPGNPTRGFEAVFAGGLHQQVNSDDFGYWKYSADLTRYLHLFYDRVLVLRVAAQRMDPLEDRSIPFYDLSELGRKETIRGFSRGRFRDRDLILATAEYRYPIWRNWDEYGIDFLLFADAGQVSPDLFEEASWDNFQTGLGFGMRLWDQDGLALKLEAGWSAEEWRIYFVLN